MNTPENREQMAEIYFETFNVAGLYIGVQAVLALYAGVVAQLQDSVMSPKPEQLTGTVVDSGDGVTHVIPVVDSFVVGSCIKHIPLAGRDITKFIIEIMRERGEKFPIEDAIYLAQQVKERYSYICPGDLVAEFQKYDTKGKENGILTQSPEFVRLETTGAITKTNLSVDIGYERFLGPEMFFHPEFVSKEWSKPIDEVIDNAIQNSPIDARRRLYNNIVMSGGSTLVSGFDERLQNGIQARVQERYNKYAKMSKDPIPPITVKVLKNMAQRFAVWFGGSFLATNVFL
jgi:actin-related protein 3